MTIKEDWLVVKEAFSQKDLLVAEAKGLGNHVTGSAFHTLVGTCVMFMAAFASAWVNETALLKNVELGEVYRIFMGTWLWLFAVTTVLALLSYKSPIVEWIDDKFDKTELWY